MLSIYDKSVEYISGGSNVADIKEFFWKWRRQHRPYSETNLDRWFANLVAARPEGDGEPRRLRRHRRGRIERWTAGAMAERLDGGSDGGGGDGMTLGARSRRQRAGGRADGRRWQTPPMQLPTAGRQRSRARRRATRSSSRPSAANSPTRPCGSASLETDNDGIAEVELDMPENLTAWKIQRLGHGPRHARRRGDGRGRHPQEPHRPAAGAAVLRRDATKSCSPPTCTTTCTTAKQVQVRLELDGDTLELPTRRRAARSKSRPAASSASIGA